MTNVNNHQKEKKGLPLARPEDEKISYQSDNGYPWEKSSTVTQDENEQSVINQTDKVFGQDFRWYLKVFGWPIVILIIAEISLEVGVRRYFPLFPEERLWEISLIIRWLTFVFIAIYALKKVRVTFPQLIVSCLSGAFIAGITISLFQLFWYSGLWTIFNIIGLPLLIIFESLIIAVIINWIYKLIK